MNAREFIEVMLHWANDETLDTLLQTPGLEFLYPNPGLVWVSYVGKSSARTDKGVITFDPSKIQGIRCMKQVAVIEPTKEPVPKIIKETLSLSKEIIAKEGLRRIKGKTPLSFKL